MIKEYMATNGNCSLPCFWGLIPGENSWSHTQQLLEYLNLPLRRYSREVGVYCKTNLFLENDPMFRGTLTFYEQDEYVKIIGFSSNDPTLSSYYELQNVMSDLGVPAYIGINLVVGGPTGTPDFTIYDIVIHYGELLEEPWVDRPWARLVYSGTAFKVGERYRFCPTDLELKELGGTPNNQRFGSGLSLKLQSLQNPVSLEELATISGKDYLSEPPTIEEAVGISVQEFYNQVMGSEDVVCFDTPIEFWPDF
jgi:hypothetical protein